jgi:endonuclease/exonuclease/phosphatase family metal-dependent hydrolase
VRWPRAAGSSLLAGLVSAGVAAQAQAPPVSLPAPIARTSPVALRVVTWNIGANAGAPSAGGAIDIEGSSRPAAFARVMRALDPDVVCLQEYTRPPARAAALFDALRPLAGGRRWQAFNALGNVLLSRYPLADRTSRTLRFRLSQRAHAIARVDVPDSIAMVDPVAVCTHLQSGGGAANAGFRQRHSETILRDVAPRLPRHGTVSPLIVMGDLNAVDGTVPYLLSRGSEGASPLSLADARPLHNGAGPERYTWRDDSQRFAPGVLDYVLFSGNALAVRQAFVLNTTSLDSLALLAFGLRRGDTMRDAARGVHDHLPVVVDLEWTGAASSARPFVDASWWITGRR